jgi:hypothetical protein
VQVAFIEDVVAAEHAAGRFAAADFHDYVTVNTAPSQFSAQPTTVCKYRHFEKSYRLSPAI